MTVGIRYVDGPCFARSVVAASDWGAAGRHEIDRINVFPVADGDTGTEFSRALRAVADALRALGDASLSGRPPHGAPIAKPTEVVMPAALAGVSAEPDRQFCTEVPIHGSQLPAANAVRTQLRNFGGSVQVAGAGDILKIHVHPGTPEAVFTYAARRGTIDATKAEDMQALSGTYQSRVAATKVAGPDWQLDNGTPTSARGIAA